MICDVRYCHAEAEEVDVLVLRVVPRDSSVHTSSLGVITSYFSQRRCKDDHSYFVPTVSRMGSGNTLPLPYLWLSEVNAG